MQIAASKRVAEDPSNTQSRNRCILVSKGKSIAPIKVVLGETAWDASVNGQRLPIHSCCHPENFTKHSRRIWWVQSSQPESGSRTWAIWVRFRPSTGARCDWWRDDTALRNEEWAIQLDWHYKAFGAFLTAAPPRYFNEQNCRHRRHLWKLCQPSYCEHLWQLTTRDLTIHIR